MTNPAPVLLIEGTVRAVVGRDVAAVEARAEQRDADGTITVYARDAREAYHCEDLTILTTLGGFSTIVVTPPAQTAMNGTMPSVGDSVLLPVYPYVTWAGQPGRRYPVAALSVAADHVETIASRTRAKVPA